MIRRQFLKLATLTGATGLASLGALDALEKHGAHTTLDAKNAKTVTWRIRGFTCPTCAIGLETLLRQQKGVATASASYPKSSVTIQFHPDQVSQTSLQSFIAELGFSAKA